MKTQIEELKEKLHIEKEKIAALEAEIQMLQQQSKYPKSKLMELWVCESKILTINGQYFSKKYLIFAALVETCKEWNKIDGFEPDWNSNTPKYQVKNESNKLSITHFWYYSSPIYFKTQETAQLFLDTYRAELEQVKDLI